MTTTIQPTTIDHHIPGTSYRGTCTCGFRVGTADDLATWDAAEALLRAHAKQVARKARRTGAVDAPDQHGLTIIPMTPDARRIERDAIDRRWAEHLRDRYVPEKRMAVADAIRGVARDLANLADEVVRQAAYLEVDREDARLPAQAVERVQHDVLWGLANIGLDRLIGRLRDLDDYRAQLAAKAHLLTPATTEGN